MNITEKFIFFLLFFEIIFSAVLAFQDITKTPYCIVGTECAAVQNSSYSTIIGVKLSVLAVTAFMMLLLLYLLTLYYKRGYLLFLKATFLGSVLASYLLYVQLIILKKICALCTTIDAIMIIVFLYFSYSYIYHNKS